jgi:cysteine desulfurase/selenocysteine lyase
MIDRIAEWDQQLVDHLVSSLDDRRYDLISPAAGPSRSTLVVLSRRDGTAEQRHRQLADAGIDVAFREGNLRISPHLFTTMAEIDNLLDALHAATVIAN